MPNELEVNHPAIEYLETLSKTDKWELRESLARRLKPTKYGPSVGTLHDQFAKMTDAEWLVFLLRLF